MLESALWDWVSILCPFNKQNFTYLTEFHRLKPVTAFLLLRHDSYHMHFSLFMRENILK